MVASLPATIDVIHEVHYVNPTDEAVEIYSQVNGYTVPADDSNESIWGGQTRDENIFIHTLRYSNVVCGIRNARFDRYRAVIIYIY